MESNSYYENSYYEVEKIIARKKINGEINYLIKWLCYPIADCTWEPFKNLENINDMIESFEEGYPGTVDLKMYKIYQNSIIANNKKEKTGKKLLSKKRKHEEILSNEYTNNIYIEESDSYLDLLKNHLYITNNSRKENYIDENSKYINNSTFEMNENKLKKIKLREIRKYGNNTKNQLIKPILS